MELSLQRTDLLMLAPVIGPASKHWSVMTRSQPSVQVGAMVKRSYEPFEVYLVDAEGDVVRRATFESVHHALRWLERHCFVVESM